MKTRSCVNLGDLIVCRCQLFTNEWYWSLVGDINVFVVLKNSELYDYMYIVTDRGKLWCDDRITSFRVNNRALFT